MDHFERYWNICAKTACGRVHPVAVVTASSRISRNSRARIGSVLLFFSADHRDECTLDNPHMARPLVGARVAIWRASFATSECWQSPQLPDGLGHAPVSRRCSNISQKGPCTDHTRLCCSSRLRAAPQLPCQKSGIYPRFDSAAGLGQIPLISGQIPYLILRVTGLDSASGPIPGNGQHWR